MNWLEESTDENTNPKDKLFDDLNSFKNYLELPKENILFLEENKNIPGVRSACYLQWLVENINLSTDINIVIWASSQMTHTTESGPWTRTFYINHEGKMFKAIRQIAQHLSIPTENVLFLIPGDEFQQEKIGEFIGNFLSKFDECKHIVSVWLKCTDKYHPRILKRMVL